MQNEGRRGWRDDGRVDDAVRGRTWRSIWRRSLYCWPPSASVLLITNVDTLHWFHFSVFRHFIEEEINWTFTFCILFFYCPSSVWNNFIFITLVYRNHLTNPLKNNYLWCILRIFIIYKKTTYPNGHRRDKNLKNLSTF